MSPDSIQKLVGRHRGETAWIFGKGPGLDTIDFGRTGPLRICINESVLRVPDPTYFFAHDEKPISNAANSWPDNCSAVLEPARCKLASERGVPKDQIYSYRKRPVDRESLSKPRPPTTAAGELAGLTGTVHSAIDFCRLVGVTEVKLVGLNGAGEYASSLNLQMPLGGGRHALIRQDSQLLLYALGLPYEFIADHPVKEFSVTASIDYQALYDKLRSQGYHDEDDRQSHIDPYVPWVVNHLHVESVLDIGCSSGRSLDRFEEAGIKATGVDVSELAVQKGVQAGRTVHRASATSLPFEDQSFDLVCSADVFEHLAPGDAEQACLEALRVSKRYVFMKIAEREDATQKWKDIAGHPLHLTTKPIGWWMDFFREHGKFLREEPEVFCFEKVVANHSNTPTKMS